MVGDSSEATATMAIGIGAAIGGAVGGALLHGLVYLLDSFDDSLLFIPLGCLAVPVLARLSRCPCFRVLPGIAGIAPRNPRLVHGADRSTYPSRCRAPRGPSPGGPWLNVGQSLLRLGALPTP
jgi:hypothetical protein